MDAANNSLILLTGAQGFIGRAVGKLLQREGYLVVALDQKPAGGAKSFGSGREIVADIADMARVREIFQAREIAAVIHLAAILPTVAQLEPRRAAEVNVTGSAQLLEMAHKFGVRRFVFGSSLSVYGTHSADEVVSEESCAAPEDLYGASKLYVEQLGAAYRERFGLQFVSLRIGRVVGPGARSSTSAWRSEIFEFLRAREPAEITIPYVDSERLLLVPVDDVARALLKLLAADEIVHTVYNAPCEAVLVGDLKRKIEELNPKIKLSLGKDYAKGNPRAVDWGRFSREFGPEMMSIFELLEKERAGSSLDGLQDAGATDPDR